MTPTRDPNVGQWEITDVPPFVVDGVTHNSYGPYMSEADAKRAIRGIEQFNRIYKRELAEENKQAAALTEQWEQVLAQ